jgi:4-oxalomesaconate hydratase
MRVFASQAYLVQYYSQRAEHRANHARRVSGLKDIERAEAFQRVLPQVLRIL